MAPTVLGTGVALLLFLVSCIRGQDLATYEKSKILVSGQYELYWTYKPESSALEMAVRVKTLGWFGLGVSADGQMSNSDMVIGWVTAGGTAMLRDRFADAQALPPVDSQLDWTLVAGKEDNGWTIVAFNRALQTGDTRDRDIVQGTNRMIYAWSADGTDPVDHDSVMYHMSNRGTRGVIFVEDNEVVNDLGNAESTAFLTKDILIPSTDTTYWCAVFKLPADIQFKTQHLIKYEPVVHPEAAAHVHHMILFTCKGIDAELDQLTPEELAGGPCDAPTSPIRRCFTGTTIIAVWAVGGQAYNFPADVSFSFGGPGSPRYLVNQIHYDNPNGVAGVRDRSGFNLTYLSTGRKHDAGVLEVGHTVLPTMIVPGRAVSYSIFGVCNSSCTSNLPSDGITVFANTLHTHLAGVALTLRQYSPNGTEVLPPFDQDLNYDFNFQDIRRIGPRQIRPGDTLELECVYQTVNRSAGLIGGVATSDEMCLSFLVYYPRAEVVRCLSDPTAEAQELFFAKLNAMQQAELRRVNATYGSNIGTILENFNWDADTHAKLQSAYKEAGKNYRCFIERQQPTSPPPPPPTIPPRSKCARMARAYSADQNCSGGVNIGELLVNRSALSDTARISQLHSHFCSSQSCFDQYVNTFRACTIDVSGSRRNVTARKAAVKQFYRTMVPFTRKVYCAQKDGQLCAIQFPEILNSNFTNTLYPCAISPTNAKCSTDCCNAMRQASKKYGCCFREYLGLIPSRGPCVSSRVWKKCGIPNPGRCQTVLRNPRKRPRN